MRSQTAPLYSALGFLVIALRLVMMFTRTSVTSGGIVVSADLNAPPEWFSVKEVDEYGVKDAYDGARRGTAARVRAARAR